MVILLDYIQLLEAKVKDVKSKSKTDLEYITLIQESFSYLYISLERKEMLLYSTRLLQNIAIISAYIDSLTNVDRTKNKYPSTGVKTTNSYLNELITSVGTGRYTKKLAGDERTVAQIKLKEQHNNELVAIKTPYPSESMKTTNARLLSIAERTGIKLKGDKNNK